MKIMVIGGTGLIGSKVVEKLKQKGHEAIAGAPNTGVNTITGEGLKEAMAGAQVVIDLENSPSFEDKAVLEFFETAGRNLLAAETEAGVRHHVALSIVGIDRNDNGYFRAKVAQEKLIKTSGMRYTREGDVDDHRRLSAWGGGPGPPSRCTRIHLRPARFDCHAGAGRQGGHSRARSDFL
jgi:uncharacterized protein YbjT (DUF2867 family)